MRARRCDFVESASPANVSTLREARGELRLLSQASLKLPPNKPPLR
jgi:hypothetical protein